MSIAIAPKASSAKMHSSILANALLGHNVEQRKAVKRLLFVSHAYALIWLWTGLSIAEGYSPPIAWLLIAYGIVGQSVFYVLLRSGWTLQFKDTLFCYPQLLFGIGSCDLGYFLLPLGQSSALQVLFVLFIYDLHRLTPRQIGFAASLAAVLLTFTALAMWAAHPEGVDLLQQGVNISMAVLIIPMLSIVGRTVRHVHLAQLEKKAQLDIVLDELKRLSQRDALTGAVNRRHIHKLIDDELKRQRRTERSFSVAMLDIDFFKRINDGFGHATGDIVLQQLTAMAQAQLRASDVVARWGGEEFLVLMPETTVIQAVVVMNQLREQVAQRDWSEFAAGLTVSFSCGVFEHRLDGTIEHTIERADAALYCAKDHGRNRVEEG